jgi:hypothetical protein
MTTLGIGVVAMLLTSVVGPAVSPLLIVAVLVMVKANRLLAISGLMVGYATTFLLLLGNQLASGSTLDDPFLPLAIDAFILLAGLMLLALALALGHRGETSTPH